MKISSESIEVIKNATDIAEVVSEYTTLAKRGLHRMAFCPFDGCKQVVPMFLVNVESQIYKCFSCGATGDSIKFTMDVTGIGYETALRKLADRYKVEIVENNLTTP